MTSVDKRLCVDFSRVGDSSGWRWGFEILTACSISRDIKNVGWELLPRISMINDTACIYYTC